jgi:hypothetical protein
VSRSSRWLPRCCLSTKVTAEHSFISFPGSVDLTFKDEGNTHLIPRGTVTVADSHGIIVSKGIINDNSGLLLPEKSRLYSVQMTGVSNRSLQLSGKYTLTINYRFDGFDQFRVYKSSFNVTPPLAILMYLFVLAIVAGGFYMIMAKSGKVKR